MAAMVIDASLNGNLAMFVDVVKVRPRVGMGASSVLSLTPRNDVMRAVEPRSGAC
jgi:hypothetical protein